MLIDLLVVCGMLVVDVVDIFYYFRIVIYPSPCQAFNNVVDLRQLDLDDTRRLGRLLDLGMP